jgi:archaellum component FlaG (FlaF/FlaG flagellin family)
MESILVSMVLLVLMIVGNVTMTMNSIQSTAKVSASWKATEEQANTIMRTNIAIIPLENYYGGTLDLTVKNAGQVSISDFAKWDVIIQAQGASSEYMDILRVTRREPINGRYKGFMYQITFLRYLTQTSWIPEKKQ